VHEVKGLGVVGQQPQLKPGEQFEYTSGSAIATMVGTMRGTYHMVAQDGTEFEAAIPEFTLSVPRILQGVCAACRAAPPWSAKRSNRRAPTPIRPPAAAKP
jgi:hypothetical protein